MESGGVLSEKLNGQAMTKMHCSLDGNDIFGGFCDGMIGLGYIMMRGNCDYNSYQSMLFAGPHKTASKISQPVSPSFSILLIINDRTIFRLLQTKFPLLINQKNLRFKQLNTMQSSGIFRNRQLNEVSKSVLRLISNKIYPLNQERMRKLHKKRLKSKIVKVHTQPHQAMSLTPSSRLISSKVSTFHDFEEKTMGEHFSQLETRELMNSPIHNRDYEMTTEKIHEFIWAKRREIKCSLTSKKEGKGNQIEAEKIAQQHKCHLRRNTSNVQHCLVRLRKKLKDEYRRESQAFQTPIFRLSEIEYHHKMRPQFNFFQQNQGIEKVMERYPINEGQTKVKEDVNKQFQNDILEEIKNNQTNDKYTRMRISINHRKIVSLR